MADTRERSPTGEKRSWTLREIIQGKPINRPTHPAFVMLPIGLFSGALALDVLSKLDLVGAALAASYAIVGGLIGAALSILTGLVDRSMMRPGSKIRRVATRHMIIQLTATALFLVNFAVRWGDRARPEAHVLWLVLDVLGVATIIVGGDVGGQMVFRMGYRVGPEADRSSAEQ